MNEKSILIDEDDRAVVKRAIKSWPKDAPRTAPSRSGFTEVVNAANLMSIHRQQIISNAIMLFPSLVREGFTRRGPMNPADVFDIVLTSYQADSMFSEKTGFRAVLVYGEPWERETAAQGEAKKTENQAYESLLMVLSTALGSIRLEERTSDPKACAGGLIDVGVL